MSNTIDKAIERLRGNWTQTDGLGDWLGDGPVCAMGAIGSVLYRESGSVPMLYDSAAAIHLQGLANEEIGTAVEIFNDDPSTTEEDVLLLMKKASATLDETGQDWEVAS